VTVSQIMQKMISEAEGNHHDINHLMRVYTFAKTIGELEGLDAGTEFILEAAAIVHDIACPFCRKKYGSAPGNRQEQESGALIDAFFQGTDISAKALERIRHLVSHHHTYTGVDGLDWQILLEADFLVNADEGNLERAAIYQAKENFFRTETGRKMLDEIYGK